MRKTYRANEQKTIKQNQSYNKVLSSSREKDYRKKSGEKWRIGCEKKADITKNHKKLTFQNISPQLSIQFSWLHTISIAYQSWLLTPWETFWSKNLPKRINIRGDMIVFVKWENFTNTASHISTNSYLIGKLFQTPSNLLLTNTFCQWWEVLNPCRFWIKNYLELCVISRKRTVGCGWTQKKAFQFICVMFIIFNFDMVYCGN